MQQIKGSTQHYRKPREHVVSNELWNMTAEWIEHAACNNDVTGLRLCIVYESQHEAPKSEVITDFVVTIKINPTHRCSKIGRKVT